MNERNTIAAQGVNSSDRLPALAVFLAELASAACVDPDSPAEETIAVSQMKVDMPFELNLMRELGVWQLDAAPPTQRIETTVLPVWHRIRFTVVLDNDKHNLEPLES